MWTMAMRQERAVCLAVTTTVPAQVSGVLAGIGWDRGHPAEVWPGSLGMQSLGVVASGHQDRRSGVRSDPEAGHEIGCSGKQQRLNLLVELLELGLGGPMNTAMPVVAAVT